MISHPYAYVDFTTYKPAQVEVTDVELELQGYKQEIFHSVLSDSYLPQEIDLTYKIPSAGLNVYQIKKSSSTEQECNPKECRAAVTSNGTKYEKNYSTEINLPKTARSISLDRGNTSITVTPIDHSRSITDEEWDKIITTIFNKFEPHSFEGSPYRFFDRWDM